MCKPLQHHKRTPSQPPLSTNLIKLNQSNMSPSSSLSSSSSDNIIKKSVSFNSIHDVVHIVENYKLTLSTQQEHDKVWYSQMEMAELARKEYFHKYGHHMKEENNSSSLTKQEQQLKKATQQIINRRLLVGAAYSSGGIRQEMAIARANNKARPANKMHMSTHDALAASRRGRHPRHHNHSTTNMTRIVVKNNPVGVQQQQQQQETSSLNNNKKKANVLPATGRTPSLSPSRHRGWFSDMYHLHSHKKQ